jgi:hypothetical protein
MIGTFVFIVGNIHTVSGMERLLQSSDKSTGYLYSRIKIKLPQSGSVICIFCLCMGVHPMLFCFFLSFLCQRIQLINGICHN